MLAGEAQVKKRDVRGANVRIAGGRWSNAGTNSHDAPSGSLVGTGKRRALYAMRAG